MTHSPKIDKLTVALIAFQRALTAVPCNQTDDKNQSFADFGAVWSHVRELLTSNGLAVTQFAGIRECTTTILHASGQWISGTVDTGSESHGPRYALMHALGITQESAVVGDAFSRVAAHAVDISEWTRGFGDHAEVVWAAVRNLSRAQQTVLMRKFTGAPSYSDVIAEAQRLGGQK